ncbi:unnamed protein product, partial [Pylaiella littoralis]
MANRGAWARTRLSRKVCRVRAGLGGYGPPPGRAPPMYADYPEACTPTSHTAHVEAVTCAERLVICKPLV